ncbi:MAG: hypothetical protein A3J76_00615 [Candidatus Moranbacteria bacterium RBG_13_45_13]|nr:MAG: hypothetical protein A3J76_00615 [Candidatus Moranbacteria bacterium RBG_13_45_13]
MLKKSWFIMVFLFLAATAMLAMAMPATAQVVAGEQFLKGGQGTTVAFSKVTKAGFTMRLQNIAAVYPTKPRIKSAVEKPDNYLKKVWVVSDPQVLNSYSIYFTGTQGLWVGQGEKLKNFQFGSDILLGKASISGGAADIQIRNVLPDVDRYLLIMVSALKCPNGAVAWGSYPGYPNGKYIVWNKDGQPQLGLWVNNKTGEVEEPGDEGRQLAKQRK